MGSNKLVSIIIPVYNEAALVGNCLSSLLAQSYKPLEIVIVDDGSLDKSAEVVKRYKVKLLKQIHMGPGNARNLGARNAKGEILVFVDADMVFARDFIKDLIDPIVNGRAIGTFSKNEMVKNSYQIWSICWNINRNLPKERMIPLDYPEESPVYRAVKKDKFDEVGGFDTSGQYTDDWSLSRKLGIKSKLAKGAKYYHWNPSSPLEVWQQARWIGKNEFISGTNVRRIRSIFLYSFPFSIMIGITKAAVTGQILFIFFKFIYDFGVFTSVVLSFFKEQKAK